MKQSRQPDSSRVLVVDDEESVRAFVERALTDAGYEVVLASDGHEALSITETQGSFDLVVVDLLMPRMSGDEVARLLRRVDPDVKVLYFTGYSDRLFWHTHAPSPNDAFLDKPVSIVGLLEAVSLMLFGHMKGPPKRRKHPFDSLIP